MQQVVSILHSVTDLQLPLHPPTPLHVGLGWADCSRSRTGAVRPHPAVLVGVPLVLARMSLVMARACASSCTCTYVHASIGCAHKWVGTDFPPII